MVHNNVRWRDGLLYSEDGHRDKHVKSKDRNLNEKTPKHPKDAHTAFTSFNKSYHIYIRHILINILLPYWPTLHA